MTTLRNCGIHNSGETRAFNLHISISVIRWDPRVWNYNTTTEKVEISVLDREGLAAYYVVLTATTPPALRTC